MKGVLSKVVRWVYLIYLAINLLIVAILLGMWSLPRETISAFCGRMVTKYNHPVFKVACKVIDTIYFWEHNHCVENYLQEKAARTYLYTSEKDLE
jgi:hypothetical protein